jgi:Tfp pilus assembly major pilin PilA
MPVCNCNQRTDEPLREAERQGCERYRSGQSGLEDSEEHDSTNDCYLENNTVLAPDVNPRCFEPTQNSQNYRSPTTKKTASDQEYQRCEGRHKEADVRPTIRRKWQDTIICDANQTTDSNDVRMRSAECESKCVPALSQKESASACNQNYRPGGSNCRLRMRPHYKQLLCGHNDGY